MLLKEIEVKNTLATNVKLLLSENLPLSASDKVSVKLSEPVLNSNPSVKLNKENNLEYDLNLEPQKTELLTIKYTIEQPSDKTIQFYES
jgi:hypothetical protein